MDFAPVPRNVVGTSPYGPDDEIGRLNLITPDSRQRILSRVDPARIYDLSVDYFMGCRPGSPLAIRTIKSGCRTPRPAR
jgi:hypothetical protein